jgi:predicted dehydrogenase
MSRSEGGGCLYDYASHAIDILNYLVGQPTAVGGTILNKVFSRDVEDEVYATLFFPDGMTGQIAANWSDDSFRRMSMEVTIWGTNGRMTIDRQQINTFIRDAASHALPIGQGWEVRYTTDLPLDVWYYLRGEEYSAQIDHFFRCIDEGRKDNVSSFTSAVQTDLVVSMMLQNAERSFDNAETRSKAQASKHRSARSLLTVIKGALR